MTRYCKCDQWKELEEKRLSHIGTISPQETRSVELSSFLFCPWCGVRLVSPCWHCGSPSDEQTGNTLYWEGEKNFCSVECVMEAEMEKRRN
ncbi:MAG TPA: hypothetical protein ENH65_12710 [Candidatus Aminicenantes bacterium]|nr:hypothetical protein [Candidatus Aminicenantes bacterium]